MSDFVTVFEIGRQSNGVWWDTLFRLVIGIVTLVSGAAGLVKWWGKKSGRSSDWLFPLLAVGWSVFWLYLHDFPHGFGRVNSLVGAYEKKQYQVVEGEVRVLHQQPVHGHSGGDIIVVNGVRFEVNYFLYTPAYRNTIAHGGALKHGVYGRIYYHDDAILRVDIRKP
jgi:hypothetical protein